MVGTVENRLGHPEASLHEQAGREALHARAGIALSGLPRFWVAHGQLRDWQRHLDAEYGALYRSSLHGCVACVIRLRDRLNLCLFYHFQHHVSLRGVHA